MKSEHTKQNTQSTSAYQNTMTVSVKSTRAFDIFWKMREERLLLQEMELTLFLSIKRKSEFGRFLFATEAIAVSQVEHSVTLSCH